MRIRKLLLTLFISLFAFVLSAQVTSQGNFMMGGTVGFSTAESSVEIEVNGETINNQGARTTQLNIAPGIGYFLVDNWALGIGLDYTLNEIKEPVDIDDPDTEFEKSYDSDLLFGPFTRFYFPVGEDKAFFFEGTLGFGSSQSQIAIDGQDQTITNNVLALGVGPGFTIISNDAIGIEAIFKYNWARSNAELDIAESSSQTTTFTNQFDFSIGFQVYFSRVQPAEVGEEDVAPEGDIDESDFY